MKGGQMRHLKTGWLFLKDISVTEQRRAPPNAQSQAQQARAGVCGKRRNHPSPPPLRVKLQDAHECLPTPEGQVCGTPRRFCRACAWSRLGWAQGQAQRGLGRQRWGGAGERGAHRALLRHLLTPGSGRTQGHPVVPISKRNLVTRVLLQVTAACS